MNNFRRHAVGALWVLPLAGLMPLTASAQLVVSDTLTGASSTYGWKPLGGACLTAGDDTGSIPGCKNLSAYSGKTQVGGVSGRLPDPIGQGALRLTNGDTTSGSNGDNQAGSVVSTATFPTTQGVKVTFTTATYGGDGLSNSGADGIAFFLMDGGKVPSIGSPGGSLGYSCSNINAPGDGVDGGYLAVAVDEYGNFSNLSDTTSTGNVNSRSPGTIVVRGSGSVTFASLQKLNAIYYPGSLSSTDRIKAVQATCKNGRLQDWSNSSKPKDTSQAIQNYPLLAQPQAVSASIFSQEATFAPLRSKANFFSYDLSITQDGLLSLSYNVNNGVVQPIITKQSITANNGPLPPSFRFGFTSGTGGGSNVHEILCFKAAQINAASTSAGTNIQESARVQAGSQVYLAYFHPQNSWGQLTASSLVADSLGNLTINPAANWDASCSLTGGACGATGATTTAQATRTMLSWNGTSGIPFQYLSMTAAQKVSMGLTDGLLRTSYLRGDRVNEVPLSGSGTGTYRRRDSILGDIMNSSPTWVGAPSSPYDLPGKSSGKDLLSNATVAEFGSAYASFSSANATRPNTVYVGANDGMLHGFRAGAYDANNNFTTKVTPNDGMDVLSYVPSAVISSIHPSNSALDYSSPQYAHNAYVDATPGTGDLFYSGAWHTWLVGGLGAGGNASGTINDKTSTANGVLYALDITDPTQFSESNAVSLVRGEWDSTSIVCVNVTCNTSLGSVYGTPIIRRLHDGNWAVIFGNGRNSTTGAAGVFIMTVNAITGARSFRFLAAGTASSGNKNGIDYVASADLDGDHVTDYLYAGDYQGKVWRFDLTSSDPAQWAASSTPLFTTATGQPITTALTVNSVVQSTGNSRIVVAFGTGEQLPQTLNSGAAYASNTQSFYGIWDWNMASWNGKSQVKYVSLAAPQSFGISDLTLQTITTISGGTGSVANFRTVSQNPVCWSGSSVCSGSNTKFGWRIDFSSTEQVIFNPRLAYGALIFNTTLPAVAQTLSCSNQPSTGYTMAISPDTGGALTTSLFATAAKAAALTATGGAIISGLGLSATGGPSIVMAGGNPFLVQQTVTGVGIVTRIDPIAGRSGRMTWHKLL
ncbi:PilC/PilY family type IV pilus protein [Actimicrobium sp. CCI2.3]|uniref:PilC/PilY family type IV pilus protein n=1 Tax=Actimicrobium sp. CCI2.3 TaxID=3048616 RepID=UPI002AB38218|nr:PilC/PilY family type IV pilus protein [Actimicrobium sp. CCI2.3]MDY7576331.1 PilC/PilY family type IV pilus protein [Actimicrobium sp. CCI2.3]MEB0020465.1 PilC/PilY family type IV pilus protein [Actimicrobium sp. CCI2.3]